MSELPSPSLSAAPYREPAGPAPDEGYLRRLLVFLSVATFFEGYDMFVRMLEALREQCITSLFAAELEAQIATP